MNLKIDKTPYLCKIPVPREFCEDKRYKCSECPNNKNCDYAWIIALWEAENKKFGDNSLLGPANPISIKPEFRKNHMITSTGKYDFCRFNSPRSKDFVTIYDLYVDEAARGQGLSKKLIYYLMEKFDKDAFAKCVRGTSAEQFWAHIGTQVDANLGEPEPHDMYEHREGKRDLGWYIVKNKNKKNIKEDLW